MRRLVLIIVLAVGIAPAFAQDAVEEKPRSYNDLSQREKEHEAQQQEWQGPSGFWTSPHKAKGGAYRYRMMGIGAVLVAGTGYLIWRLIKNANNDRDKRG